jgi:pimeloyl-ACP methyl ester carboxylesterase
MRSHPSAFFVPLAFEGEHVALECVWFEPAATQSNLTWLMLHEGLGSVSLWKGFGQQLADAMGERVLAYSRPGYGQSTPRAEPRTAWRTDFMHAQAWELLPALLQALDLVGAPIGLFGHSDGASIALLHAARNPQVQAVVALAPHLFVETVTTASIARTKVAFESGELRSGLARHHADADSAFWGWYGAWMSPEFAAWNIEAEVAQVRCPVLAIQGEDDAYGTMSQVEAIARLRSENTQLLKLASCGHSPHRDQPSAVLQTVSEWAKKKVKPLRI